jgi:hypothetical protein
MNVRSSVPTNVRSGETRLASMRTRYEIKFRRKRKSLTGEWIVYEGEVTVKTPTTLTTIRQGEELVAQAASDQLFHTIASENLRGAATAYAKIDVSQTNISNREELQSTFLKLQTLHLEVLADPNNRSKRINLKSEQIRLGIPSEELKLRDNPTPISNPEVGAKPAIGAKKEPAAETRVWNVALMVKTKTTDTLPVVNPCFKMHRMRVTLKNLPFAHLLSSADIEVSGRGKTELRFEFDTIGVKAGNYRGQVVFDCLDCSGDDDCLVRPRDLLQVIVNIQDKK